MLISNPEDGKRLENENGLYKNASGMGQLPVLLTKSEDSDYLHNKDIASTQSDFEF